MTRFTARYATFAALGAVAVLAAVAGFHLVIAWLVVAFLLAPVLGWMLAQTEAF